MSLSPCVIVLGALASAGILATMRCVARCSNEPVLPSPLGGEPPLRSERVEELSVRTWSGLCV